MMDSIIAIIGHCLTAYVSSLDALRSSVVVFSRGITVRFLKRWIVKGRLYRPIRKLVGKPWSGARAATMTS